MIMEYTLRKVWLHLKFSWKKYLFLSLEFTVGITVLLCGINSRRSTDEHIAAMQEQTKYGLLEIHASAKNIEAAEGSSVTYQTYSEVKKDYPLTPVYFQALCTDLVNVGSEMIPVNVLFVSEPLFEQWFGLKMEPGTVYCGSSVPITHEFQSIFSQIHCSGGTVSCGGQTYKLSSMAWRTDSPNNIESIYISTISGDSISVDETLFMPAESILYALPQSYTTKLFVSAPDAVSASATAYNLVGELTQKNAQYDFYIVDPLEVVKSQLMDLTGTLRFMTFLSYVTFAIIVVGMSGVLIVILKLRQKEFAISIMLGSSKLRIFVELILEVLCVCLVGTFCGIIISFFLTPLLSNSLQTVSFHCSTLLISLEIVVLITTISVLVALSNIKQKNPMKSLREEQ